MKIKLRFIFAIPLGIISSIYLPKYFSLILDYFISIDTIIELLNKYFIPFISGWISIGVTYLLTPSKKILTSGILVALNLIASVWLLYHNQSVDYLYNLGGIIALILIPIIVKYKQD